MRTHIILPSDSRPLCLLFPLPERPFLSLYDLTSIVPETTISAITHQMLHTLTQQSLLTSNVNIKLCGFRCHLCSALPYHSLIIGHAGGRGTESGLIDISSEWGGQCGTWVTLLSRSATSNSCQVVSCLILINVI